MMISNRLISRLERIDWDFAGAFSESPFSAIHWHPARLPSQVAASFIGVLTEPGDLVLDPFLGSGTTLVEAQRLDRRSIGIDLNPVACLIATAKTLGIPATRLARVSSELKGQAVDVLSPSLMKNSCSYDFPAGVQTKWYSKRTLSDLAALWAVIHESRGIKRKIAHASFSAILLPVCRETRHWGYVCDNSTPKTDREGDVLTEYLKVLDRFTAAYVDRDADREVRSAGKARLLPVSIRCGDSLELLNRIEERSVDLVLTSPPYFGVSDYVKAQRLSTEWFGIEIEPLRKREVGARSKRHRALAATEYLTELSEMFCKTQRLLKPGGACVIIIGESATRQSTIDEFSASLTRIGYTIAMNVTRNVSTQRRQYNSIGTEAVIVATVSG